MRSRGCNKGGGGAGNGGGVASASYRSYGEGVGGGCSLAELNGVGSVGSGGCAGGEGGKSRVRGLARCHVRALEKLQRRREYTE